MAADLVFWIVARASGLAAFAALAIALLTGIALRTSVLDWLASNRALRAVHEFSNALWIPLGVVHVLGLLLDRTARIDPEDVVVPFLVPEEYGTLGVVAIGLGTLAFDIFLVVTVTGWLRRRMDQRLWSWIHRASYVAFVLLFAHGVFAGTDFNTPLVSTFAWSVATLCILLGVARILFGRLPA